MSSFKMLHTSDWHLGCRLMNKDRDEEQEEVLNWLIKTVEHEKISLLIVAGDVFDTGAPANSARRLYYGFLRKLILTGCEHVVIVGGNHDSPSMIEAPKEILELLNIYVIGAAFSDSDGNIDYTKEIVEIRNDKNELQAVVGAVPFLRDRDIMKAIAGQSYDDRITMMREGIREHYNRIAELLNEYKDVPRISAGHLFDKNTILSGNALRQEGENDIHIGNLAQVDMSSFNDSFSYIALGHIHKPQSLGKFENVRYSGSLIQMSFSEREDKKTVTLVDFSNGSISEIKQLEVSETRKIMRFKGTVSEINAAIGIFKNTCSRECWCELVLTESASKQDLDEIKEIAKEREIEVLKYGFDIPLSNQSVLNERTAGKTLEDLTVDEIFDLKCIEDSLTIEESDEVKKTFTELKSFINNPNE